MAKIQRIFISQFLGIGELKLEPGKVTVVRGPKGKGKSSILQALMKGFLNKNLRTEVIKHGSEEAMILIKLDDGLEILRKLRIGKADYLKVRKENEGVPSTEKFMKSLINSIALNPIEFIEKNSKEQTEYLLSFIEVEWCEEDIINWFGRLEKDIDYTQHILTILKNTELFYYKTREEVNRSIKELKGTIEALYSSLPLEYDGEEWRGKNVDSYYNRVYVAQERNKLIGEAKEVEESFRGIVQGENSRCEEEVYKLEIKYRDKEEEIKSSLSKIDMDKLLGREKISSSSRREELEITKLQGEYEKEHRALIEKYDVLKEEKRKEIYEEKEKEKEKIMELEEKTLELKEEILELKGKKENEINIVRYNLNQTIERERIKLSRASQYLEKNKEILINPLIEEAKHVNEMVNNLKDWDRIKEIRDEKLAPKEMYSSELTFKIEKARALPKELLKTAKMPVKGITIDGNGLIRIDGKLIDGLSDGEKLDLALRVARESCGDLKVICIDRFECLDKQSQKKLLKEIEKDDFQYFITEVSSTKSEELEIEKIGEGEK